MELLEKVLEYSNVKQAFKQVVSNGGSKGVDGVTTKDFDVYMHEKWEEISFLVRKGRYFPQAVLGVEIPKSNGGKRLLGIPTVIDRLLQQAIHQVLYPIFDVEFSEYSYGFRKGKSAHQAVIQSLSYINSGYQDIIDLDLKSFFDIVNQDYLMSLLNRKIKDKLLLQLIRRFLKSDMMLGGMTQQRNQGTPQGSPLSPLLSNIILNELDNELARRGLRFVRYADDCSIFLKSKRAAKRVLFGVQDFIERKLHLKVNEEKTQICRPINYNTLGYGFVASYKKGEKGKYNLRVSPKSFKRMKQRVKEITRKTSPLSFDVRISKLNAFVRGWINYYKYANLFTKLKYLDGWVRNRLRYCIWKHWKRPNKRMRSYIRLGISKNQAYAWSRSRMGGWAVACSPMMKTTVTKKRLVRRGYLSFSTQFKKSKRLIPDGIQLKLPFV